MEPGEQSCLAEGSAGCAPGEEKGRTLHHGSRYLRRQVPRSLGSLARCALLYDRDPEAVRVLGCEAVGIPAIARFLDDVAAKRPEAGRDRVEILCCVEPQPKTDALHPLATS